MCSFCRRRFYQLSTLQALFKTFDAEVIRITALHTASYIYKQLCTEALNMFLRKIWPLLTHSLTHSLIHSLTYSLTHSLTHSFTHSLIHTFTHSLTHTSLTHSHIHSLTHPRSGTSLWHPYLASSPVRL